MLPSFVLAIGYGTINELVLHVHVVIGRGLSFDSTTYTMLLCRGSPPHTQKADGISEFAYRQLVSTSYFIPLCADFLSLITIRKRYY